MGFTLQQSLTFLSSASDGSPDNPVNLENDL